MKPINFTALSLQKNYIISFKTNKGKHLMGLYRNNFEEIEGRFLYYNFETELEEWISLVAISKLKLVVS